MNEFLKVLDDTELENGRKLLERSIKLASQRYKSVSFKGELGFRLVSGMGYPSPIENGFLFHHTYGIPYISANAIRGLTRYVYLLKEHKEEPTEELIRKYESGRIEDEKYEIIFGNQKKEGKVVFFDAYPESLKRENFVIDVMNPHLFKYYESKGEKNPSDWYNPVPILFLSLEGVSFVFTIGVKEGIYEEYLEEVKTLLKEGLETFGVGAKTRRGYGWMEVKD
ncbi:hypothetical protein JCM9492_05120 [Aquifex pyrophilus]